MCAYGSQGEAWGFLIYHFPPEPLGQDLSLNLKFASFHWTGGQQALAIHLCTPFPRHTQTCPTLSMSAGDETQSLVLGTVHVLTCRAPASVDFVFCYFFSSRRLPHPRNTWFVRIYNKFPPLQTFLELLPNSTLMPRVLYLLVSACIMELTLWCCLWFWNYT